jgi:hypothetical protein
MIEGWVLETGLFSDDGRRGNGVRYAARALLAS